MSSQSKPKLLIWAEYLTALPVLYLLRLMPYRLSLGMARLLGLLAYLASPTWRKVSAINLGIAFQGRLSSKQTRRITRHAFVNFAQTIAELVYFLGRPDDLLTRTDCEELESLKGALRRGRGVIVCQAHFSNWYWPVIYAASLGISQSVVVRPLDNPKLNRRMNRILDRRGITPLPRARSVRTGLAALRRGEILGLMVDQNAAVGGRFVPFFGVAASTMRGVAVMCRLTGAEVVCVHHLRDRETGRHRIVVSEPIAMPDDEELALRCINRYFERVVRQHPEAYFWMHPRWKRRPEGGATLYPGLRV